VLLLNNAYAKFYNSSEHLAVDKIIVLFRGRVVFKQYIPKIHKRFGIKIFKLRDCTGYAYDMKVYLGKDRQHVTGYDCYACDYEGADRKGGKAWPQTVYA
jgi:hypothetical protein